MAYDPVSTAMRGLSGSLERLGSNIGQSISARSDRALEEMKLDRLYQNDEQNRNLKALQIESAAMTLEKQKQAAAVDAQPFPVAEWVDESVKKLIPDRISGGIGMGGGEEDGTKPIGVGAQQAIFGFKKWAAKILPAVILSVFDGDVEIRQGEAGPTLYSKSRGKTLTKGDIKNMGDFEERAGYAIGGLTHGEKLLQLLAGAGDPQAIKALKEYDTEEGKLRRYQYELDRKMELKSMAGTKGINTSAIDEGIKYTQGKIDRIIAKMGTPEKPITLEDQISFERDKKAAVVGLEPYKALTREQKIQDITDAAAAKRGPKEPPYSKLTRERDEDDWNKARDIIDAWEGGEKTVNEDGSEVVDFVDEKGNYNTITKKMYEKSLKIYDELDKKFKGEKSSTKTTGTFKVGQAVQRRGSSPNPEVFDNGIRKAADEGIITPAERDAYFAALPKLNGKTTQQKKEDTKKIVGQVVKPNSAKILARYEGLDIGIDRQSNQYVVRENDNKPWRKPTDKENDKIHKYNITFRYQ